MSHKHQSNPTRVYEAGDDPGHQKDFVPERAFLPSPAETVLDIGCGGGDLACFLAQKAGFVVGLDVSLDILQQVAKKIQSKNLQNVYLVVADVNQLPFKDKCINYVVSRYALHHTDLDTSLPEIQRILLPGGRLFLRDIFARWPKLEKYVALQIINSLLKVALHVVTHGPRSGYRFLKFTFTANSFNHILYENRLCDEKTYRSTHRRWFPGCRFEQLRPWYIFWEAPAMKWQKPDHLSGSG